MCIETGQGNKRTMKSSEPKSRRSRERNDKHTDRHIYRQIHKARNEKFQQHCRHTNNNIKSNQSEVEVL